MRYITEPDILAANTFHWKPSMIADVRRRREETIRTDVAEYLKQIGFRVVMAGSDYVADREFHGKRIDVSFNYSETTSNVYKYCQVYVDGKKSNITTLRKIAQHVDDLQYIAAEIEWFNNAGAIIPLTERGQEFGTLLTKYRKHLTPRQIRQLEHMSEWHGVNSGLPATKPLWPSFLPE